MYRLYRFHNIEITVFNIYRDINTKGYVKLFFSFFFFKFHDCMSNDETLRQIAAIFASARGTLIRIIPYNLLLGGFIALSICGN